jgi:tetratricopeptide (TPR) repeat protein
MSDEIRLKDPSPHPKHSHPAGFMTPLLRAITITGLILLALSLFAHKIIDTDIWWHLRTGRHILETRSIPGFDMYSYTAGGNRWIDLHWLFQVILRLVNGIGGGYGLSLLFISLYGLTFTILWLAAPKGKRFSLSVLFFFCALMASNSRFLARPEAFSFVMIAVYMYILSRYERGESTWLIYCLIPLQILWTNLQGLFIIGPFLVSAYLVGFGISTVIPWSQQRRTGANAPGARPLLIIFGGVVLSCLVNPYGIEGALFPFTLFTRVGGVENIFAQSIAEFQPPFSGYNLTSSIKWFAVFLLLSAAVMAMNYKRMRPQHLLVFAGLAYLALNARRNIPPFVLAVLPIAVTHGSEVIERFNNARDGRFSGAIERIALVCCVALSIAFGLQIVSVINNRYYINDRRAERFGFGFKEQTHPRGAFVFIRENEIRGPFFNNLDVGGMFIHELYPRERVFIDARLEVNSAEVFSEYRRAMSDAQAFGRLSQKYLFKAIVISHVAQDALFLVPVLHFSPQWKLVYLDPIAAVFVKATREHENLITEYGINIAEDYIEPFAPHDTVNEGSPQLLRALLSVDTADVEAHNLFNLGLVFLVMREYERAIAYLDQGLELMPDSSEAYYNIGLAYDRMGRTEEAVEHYRESIRLDARRAAAHANLGEIYDRRGLQEKAEKEYHLALKYDRKSAVVLYNLGALYYERGEYDRARTYWERALKVKPSFAPAKEGLERLKQSDYKEGIPSR